MYFAFDFIQCILDALEFEPNLMELTTLISRWLYICFSVVKIVVMVFKPLKWPPRQNDDDLI